MLISLYKHLNIKQSKDKEYNKVIFFKRLAFQIFLNPELIFYQDNAFLHLQAF